MFFLELVQFSSVAQSCPTLCDPMNCSTPALPVHHQLPEFTQTHISSVTDSWCPTLWPHGLQHARLPCPSPTPGAYSNSLSRWCHPTISSSAVPFSSCLPSFPTSGSFPVSQLVASGGQNIGASALALVLLMNIQDWFPLRLTGLISLHSRGPQESSPTTRLKKHQLFGAQFS